MKLVIDKCFHSVNNWFRRNVAFLHRILPRQSWPSPYWGFRRDIAVTGKITVPEAAIVGFYS